MPSATSAYPTGALSKLTTAPVERRERRRVAMIGYALREDGSSIEVMVLDLSYEGCGIETPVPLKLGEPLKLSVLRRGAISCQVRWYANGKAGVVFDPETHAAQQRQPQPRRSKRVAIDAEVSMRRLGQINYRVRLFDASPEGCKVELVEKPRIGEHVLVKMPALEALDSEVCWVEQFTAGLRFEKTIHPAVFDLLLERLKG
jgi:hypothetical protein